MPQAVGIIAEFNPFHNGHAYLFSTLRARGLSPIVCVMSGPFTQRGEAALCTKWARAAMARACGADLVVALPFFSACRSAGEFAAGGIRLLRALGVRHLAFGCETADRLLLDKIARLIAEEPPVYKATLRAKLKTGAGFAAARAAAIAAALPEAGEGLPALLKAPNTILALEYLRVLQEEGNPLTPVLIPRTGAGYHDETLQALASAAAIRGALYRGEDVAAAMPPAALACLEAEISAGRAPFQPGVLDTLILGRLRLLEETQPESIFEMGEGLHHRIPQAATAAGTFEDCVARLSGKRYPKSRIRRLLLYTLLGLTREKADAFHSLTAPPFAQILALTPAGQAHLKTLNPKTAPVLLASGRELRRFLHNPATPEPARTLLQLELKAEALYRLGLPDPQARRGDADYYLGAFQRARLDE